MPVAAPLDPIPAAVSGTVAAGVAIAAGELTTAILDSPTSLVTAVGNEFVDRFAASLKELAVELFGTNDKVALVTGIIVTSLLLGAGLGLLTRHTRLAVPLGFAAFGVVGGWSLASDPQGSTSTAVLAATVAALAGIGTFYMLAWLGRRGGAVPGDAPPIDRRRFLTGVAASVVTAGLAAILARRVRADDSVDAQREDTVLPDPGDSSAPPVSERFELPGLSAYVTPNDDFYRIDTALSTPQVDAGDWRLRVTGLVDAPFELGYDELLALDSVETTVTIACVSNEVGGRLVGNAVWQGVPLATLLERAGVQHGASQVVGRSVDGFTAGFPLDTARDGRTAIVAYAMNGEPLPADHGYPARLIVAGLYGYVSATKWLEEIELTTWESFDGYWVPRGWSKEGPIKTASRIDVPRSGDTVAAGRQAIAGVAWAPTRGIRGVEVQIDDEPWQPAELGPVASANTWVQWHVTWDATPGEHRLRVRATDGDDITQTEEPRPPAPDGATGWHTRRIRITGT